MRRRAPSTLHGAGLKPVLEKVPHYRALSRWDIMHGIPGASAANSTPYGTSNSARATKIRGLTHAEQSPRARREPALNAPQALAVSPTTIQRLSRTKLMTPTAWPQGATLIPLHGASIGFIRHTQLYSVKVASGSSYRPSRVQYAPPSPSASPHASGSSASARCSARIAPIRARLAAVAALSSRGALAAIEQLARREHLRMFGTGGRS